MVIAGFQLSGLARSIVYKVLLFLLVLLFGGLLDLCAQFYPVHGVVQWPSPQSPYLVDYYSGSRDRLIVTLHNRDLQQPLLLARLRVQIKSNGFLAQTREEFPYPMLELMAGTPTRLTATDLMPYLRPENLHFNGRLRNGQLPTGFTEISVQVIDYYSKKVLSTWHTARAYLDSKQPPILNLPQRDEQVAYREPLFIRFQWYPRHQGLAGTEYEFVLKELPDNGAAPQAAFAYGNEIYRTRTRNTTLPYTHLEPVLYPNRRYAWQVQAIARDGVDEIGMFANGGFSEIYWFTLNEHCPVPTGLKAQARYAKVDFSWNRVVGATGYMLSVRPKTSKDIYEWSEVQSFTERTTISQLKPGWTYEWRVGTLCTGDRPIYSPVQEITLSKSNEELLADCGKEPPRRDLRQEPRLDVRVGDVVTIGGDYPMTITELQSLGDGWYSGKGKTTLRTLVELPGVALRFDRLRINVDNFQIDGLVEAVYDEKNGAIANLDRIDDGGKATKQTRLQFKERKIDFKLPEVPQMSFNAETGEIETTDAEGNPQTIKLELPEGSDYASVFPMVITDSEGNTYQVKEGKQRKQEIIDIAQEARLQVHNVDSAYLLSRDKISWAFDIAIELASDLQKNKDNLRKLALSTDELRYLNGALEHLEFLSNVDNYNFLNGKNLQGITAQIGSGGYDGQLRVYVSETIDRENIKTTILHEYLHHVNYMNKIFPYIYEDESSRRLYSKQVDSLFFREPNSIELFNMFIQRYEGELNLWDKMNATELSQEQLAIYTEFCKQFKGKAIYISGRYRASNYYLDELTVHQLCLKLINKLIRPTEEKVSFYQKEILRYSTLHQEMKKYEQKRFYLPTGKKM